MGQGSLFRAYEQRLAARNVHAAQVLLNSSDVSTRVNYLNARATLRRLLVWRAVPVINENDTTATDEITFGDNDFLAAQVALLLDARALVLLTDTAGLPSADPRRDPEARLIERVEDFGQLAKYEIGDRASLYGSGGMRNKVAAAEMATSAGIDVVVCDGRREARCSRRPGGGRGHDVPRPSRTGAELQDLAALREAEPRHRDGRRGGGRVLREQGSSLLPVGITSVDGDFEAGDAVDVVCDSEPVGKGIVNYSAGQAGADPRDEVGRGGGADAARLRGGRSPGLLRARMTETHELHLRKGYYR